MLWETKMTRQQSLKTLIKKSGLNQKQFAEKHGLRPERISEWITVKKNIYLPTLQELARIEGYSLEVDFRLTKKRISFKII